jgi:hypothetical protein
MSKSVKRRERRTPEQIISDLQRKIEEVKRRAERKKAKRDPTIRHVSAAVRSIDKAVSQTSDPATRRALGDARATLAACLALGGASASATRGPLIPRAARGAKVDPERVLSYLREHPGSRAEEIADALGTDSAGLRPSLQQLRAESRARAEGKARATRYYAESSS